jgi:hypothetical protein
VTDYLKLSKLFKSSLAKSLKKVISHPMKIRKLKSNKAVHGLQPIKNKKSKKKSLPNALLNTKTSITGRNLGQYKDLLSLYQLHIKGKI